MFELVEPSAEEIAAARAAIAAYSGRCQVCRRQRVSRRVPCCTLCTPKDEPGKVAWWRQYVARCTALEAMADERDEDDRAASCRRIELTLTNGAWADLEETARADGIEVQDVVRSILLCGGGEPNRGCGSLRWHCHCENDQ